MASFIERVQKIREGAARFYAVDLHLHSPASYDWVNSGRTDSPRDPNLDRIPPGGPIAKDAIVSYMASVKKSGRELVAVTDHNVSFFAEAAAEKNNASDPWVLPGVELTVAFSDAPLIKDLRIHVLAIFPEDTHCDAIARILPPETLPEKHRDPKEHFIYTTIDELIDKIHQEKGLAIGAHVDSTYGTRGVYKNTAELMLNAIKGTPEGQKYLGKLGDQVKDVLVKFDAIQVTPVTDIVHYAGLDGSLRLPLIVATDCHNAQELAEDKSEHYSYIKMAEPSFKALGDAFKFPDLRIRFKPGLPEAQPPRLIGLRLVGRKVSDKTFFNDVAIGFSDNLTCIIGPRGSGKSALIDAVRYLMGYNRTLDQIPEVASQIRDRQQHTLEKTRIEALYQTKDGNMFRLVATYDPQENYVTEVYSLQGEKLNIEDIEIGGDFPLSLFGWSELELLAKSTETQRELLDYFIPEVLKLKSAKKDIYSQLVANREMCVNQARDMEAYFTNPDLDFLRLKEYKKQFEELNTEEISIIFSQLDAIKAKQTTLEKIHNKLQERHTEDDLLQPLELETFFEDDIFQKGNNIKEWADTLSKRLKLQDLDDWMRETRHEYDSRIKGALSVVEDEQKRVAMRRQSAEREIQAVVGDDQSITGDLRNSAKARYEKAKANLDEYERMQNHYNTLLEERGIILEDIEKHSKQMFATRNQETSRISEKVSLVEDEHYKIDLVLKQGADKSEFLAALKKKDLVFHGKWLAGKRPEILSINLTPPELVKIILTKDIDALEDLSYRIDGAEYSMRRSDAERFVADNFPYTEHEDEEMSVISIDPKKLDTLLHIEEAPIDDEFFITLGGKAIQYCSPGQKCSAMLPIVTLTTQAPLIIDQPEDNLDNRLVSNALFKILIKLKETRQLIVATHNPNILVSGDAEQVLLLDSGGEIEHYGSIDNPQIINSVLSLMEGGADAFQRLGKKYGPYL